MVGLTSGGGYGPLTPRYGLALDNLLSAGVVHADGRLVNCDDQNNPDLSRPTLAKRRLAVVHASNRKWSFAQIMILTKVVVEGAVVMTIEDANIAAMREIFRAHIINRRDSGSQTKKQHHSFGKDLTAETWELDLRTTA